MIEGVVHHCTEMEVDRQYVDSHGQSTVAFAFCRLLDFQLLPRLKAIHEQKLYRPDVGRQVEVDGDPVQIRVAVRHALDDADHIVHIDVGQARRRALALQQGPQAANDFAGALGDFTDVGHRAPHLLEIGLGCVEQTHADVGVGEDRGEWLPQFVRQGCGELAECGNACDVLQFGPLLLEFLALLRG